MASERFRARTAPTGLALVQELVNTHSTERSGDDLLADPTSAQDWLRAAIEAWAHDRGLEPPDSTLGEADLPVLRDLRATLHDLLIVAPDQRPTGTPANLGTGRARAELVADEHGRVALLPVGTGRGWLESAVWSEILLAQQTGLWSRLKLCREAGCRSAFYDASRNGSGVWHNVRTCGNIANLHASRSRAKSRAATDRME
ncbi:MAG TPA: CGNR zinc finger domain-containing protein [Pseudonocardiaceae bacterium]|jgi:predicted RNA-binding Zn ribbon-like protein|nr:CGNR zinc finger domain-containing protein [Pseudonocardiaceae bacterium]